MRFNNFDLTGGLYEDKHFQNLFFHFRCLFLSGITTSEFNPNEAKFRDVIEKNLLVSVYKYGKFGVELPIPIALKNNVRSQETLSRCGVNIISTPRNSRRLYVITSLSTGICSRKYDCFD